MNCEPDTNALLHDASSGNAEATARLLGRHCDQLKRMVAVRMHPRLSARFDPSDVVQEAMILATKRLPQYAAERPVDFYPWLRQLTLERLIELHRRHFDREKRSVRREAPSMIPLPDESAAQLVDRLVDGDVGPRSQLLREELRVRVRSALDRLPNKYREVLVLRHLEQLSNDQTASVLGIEVSTAKTRYYRAIQQMHRSLGDICEDT